MKKKPSSGSSFFHKGRSLGLWEMAALVMAGLLFLNFLAFLLLLAFGAQPMLDPAMALFTGLLLLLGITAGFFIRRREVSKGIRRLLTAAIVLNALLVFVFIGAAALVLSLF